MVSFARRYFGLLTVLFLSFLTILPLFRSGFFPMHDDTQVARVFEMGKALKDGQFPVRWVADLGYGYGYPIFNFYAPLAYYFGGLFNVFGFDALVSTKIMIGFGMLLAGVSMYFLAREFWGEIGGIVSGLLYVYAPYHAVLLYVRGDVAEMWAYGFIPLSFLGFYKIFSVLNNKASHGLKSSKLKVKNELWKWVTIGSLAYAGIILSHNLTAIMVTPFLGIVILVYGFIAYLRKNRFIVYHIILPILLGLLLSAFYWFPALLEMKYTNVLSQIGGGANFKDHFICLPQLWNSIWGFGGSVKGCIDGMSFKIGKLHVLLALFSIFPLFITLKKDKTKFGVFLLSIFCLVFSIFLTLDVSKFIWESIPLMAFFQYPWRFLVMISFFASFLSGSALWFSHSILTDKHYFNTAHYPSLGIIIFLLLFYNLKLFQPQVIIQKNSSDYTNQYSLKWVASKISDEYMPKNFYKPASFKNVVKNKLTVLRGNVEIRSLKENTNHFFAEVNALTPSKVRFNNAYFPGWDIRVDGKRIGCTITQAGYEFSLRPGRHTIRGVFRQTTAEKIANLASLTGIVVLSAGIMYVGKAER